MNKFLTISIISSGRSDELRAAGYINEANAIIDQIKAIAPSLIP